MDKKSILDAALSPYDDYCQGFSSPGASGNSYILTPLLVVGKDKMKFFHHGSTTLDELNAFDLAGVDTVYIGQVNLIRVSSYCGPAGLVWGYDIARSDIHKPVPILESNNYQNIDGVQVNVYSAWPLIEASTALYGTLDAKHFPILPGSHVPAAWKSYTFCNQQQETRRLYCAIGLGIPSNRDENAILLMEDVGWITPQGNGSDFSEQHKDILDSMIRSVLQMGKNQNIVYQSVYVALKEVIVHPNEVGCAMVVAHYVTLARKAIPLGETANMSTISLNEWQTQTKKQ